MYLRDKYSDANDIENMTYWRNKTTELVHKSKTTYYCELIMASLKDGKKLWELIRELAPKSSSNSPTSLTSDNRYITDTQEMADYFNTFFANIAQTLIENMPTDHRPSHNKLKEFLHSKIPDDITFDIPPLQKILF